MNVLRAWSLAAASSLLWVTAASADTSILNRRVRPGQTFARALADAGLEGPSVERVIRALNGVFDFKRSRDGDQIRVVLQDGALDFLDYRQSPVDEWQVRREGDRLVGAKRSVEVEKKDELVRIEVDSSLYDSALAAGEHPDIAMALADVFAWDIDFYRDVQKGDHLVAVVEKFLSKGRLLRYGRVLAATYQGSSVGKRQVFSYDMPSGEHAYFTREGTSARKTFLKSPLKYANITSKFGNRFHPILQYVRAHNGVDYGTPVGTPVWAVADGTVTMAGFSAGNGNGVCVRHYNGMETCYLHLSRFGPGVRIGARVSQKQVIAYSGNTGLSTGPHLHFALKRGGVFVNPLNQNFPRADPLPKALKEDFNSKIAPLLVQLDTAPLAAASGGSGNAP